MRIGVVCEVLVAMVAAVVVVLPPLPQRGCCHRHRRVRPSPTAGAIATSVTAVSAREVRRCSLTRAHARRPRRSDGTVIPARATLECHVSAASSHPYSLTEAVEALCSALRDARFVDAHGAEVAARQGGWRVARQIGRQGREWSGGEQRRGLRVGGERAGSHTPARWQRWSRGPSARGRARFSAVQGSETALCSFLRVRGAAPLFPHARR